jgi:hypothetical protein
VAGDTLFTPTTSAAGTTLDSDVQNVVEMSDGSLFALHSSGVLSSFQGGSWNVADTNVTQIAVAPDATGAPSLFDLEGSGYLYEMVPGVRWQLVDSGVAQIVAAPDPSGHTALFDFNRNGVLYKMTGSGWQAIGSGVTQIVAITSTPGQTSLFDLTSNGILYEMNSSGPSSWTQVGTSGVVAADGTVWYLGTANADASGDHPIYQLQSNGNLSLIPGSAQQLSVSGGALAAVTAQGGLSILTAQGLTPVLQNVQGLTPLGNGQFAIGVGGLLRADVAVSGASANAITLTFSNVQVDLGYLGGALNAFVGQLANVTSRLAPLYTPLSGTQGFSRILNRAGVQTDLSPAGLLILGLDAMGDAQAAAAIQELWTVYQAVTQVANSLPAVPAGSLINLGNFTATVGPGGALQIGNLPGGDVFQQLGAS